MVLASKFAGIIMGGIGVGYWVFGLLILVLLFSLFRFGVPLNYLPLTVAPSAVEILFARRLA